MGDTPCSAVGDGCSCVEESRLVLGVAELSFAEPGEGCCLGEGVDAVGVHQVVLLECFGGGALKRCREGLTFGFGALGASDGVLVRERGCFPSLIAPVCLCEPF